MLALDKHLLFKSLNSLLIITSDIEAVSHRHHALQVTISMDAPFTLQCDGDEPRVFQGVIVGADIEHSLQGAKGLYATLLLDPELHPVKHILGHHQTTGFAEIDDIRFEQMRSVIQALIKEQAVEVSLDIESPVIRTPAIENPAIENPAIENPAIENPAIENPAIENPAIENPAIGNPVIESPIESLISILTQSDCEQTLDPRIVTLLDYIAQTEHKMARVEELAQEVKLSTSRLIHLFKQDVGIPIRRYLLWQRLLDACSYASLHAHEEVNCDAKNDMSLTQAAHQAGFTDSAHFSRTFKSMFGIHPSSIIKNSHMIDATKDRIL